MQIICINLHTLALMLSITILWAKGQKRNLISLGKQRRVFRPLDSAIYRSLGGYSAPKHREGNLQRPKRCNEFTNGFYLLIEHKTPPCCINFPGGSWTNICLPQIRHWQLIKVMMWPKSNLVDQLVHWTYLQRMRDRLHTEVWNIMKQLNQPQSLVLLWITTSWKPCDGA